MGYDLILKSDPVSSPLSRACLWCLGSFTCHTCFETRLRDAVCPFVLCVCVCVTSLFVFLSFFSPFCFFRGRLDISKFWRVLPSLFSSIFACSSSFFTAMSLLFHFFLLLFSFFMFISRSLRTVGNCNNHHQNHNHIIMVIT